MVDFDATEKAVLDDIERKTGMPFRRIEGIDTRKPEIADVVLPILVNWAERVKDDRSLRGAIYSRFTTPFARPHLDSIKRWWLEEKDELFSNFLTHALELVATRDSARIIWDLCREQPSRTLYYKLLAKLATFPTVERDVKEELIRALHTRTLRLGDLVDISAVNDPRIRDWFRNQLNSPDARIRSLAQKVIAKNTPLPNGVERASAGPDRPNEAFSTEVDVDEIKPLLQKLAKEYRLNLPSAVKKAEFVSRLDVDQWVVAKVSIDDAEPARLWFRLEDIDTVEVVVMRPSETAPNT